MRCKPGDLCLIVRSHPGNVGKVVTVVRGVSRPRHRTKAGHLWDTGWHQLDWEIDAGPGGSIVAVSNTQNAQGFVRYACCQDGALMPLAGPSVQLEREATAPADRAPAEPTTT